MQDQDAECSADSTLKAFDASCCRTLLRRYPDFPDVRAALAAALWAMGNGGEAESQWLRVEDPRYRDRAWLAATRRWPPRLVANLEAFLDVQSAPKPSPAPES